MDVAGTKEWVALGGATRITVIPNGAEAVASCLLRASLRVAMVLYTKKGIALGGTSRLARARIAA